MASVNKVILIGNLGSDPELRYTTGGTPVAELSIATNRRYKAKDGDWKDEAEWHKVVVWGKQGENCKEYLAKGRTVYVEGYLKTTSWEGKDGVKRYKTEVVAEQVQFLGGRDGGSGGGSGRNSGGDDPPPMGENDIPF